MPRPLDIPGQLLAVAFLATLTYALIEAPTRWGSARPSASSPPERHSPSRSWSWSGARRTRWSTCTPSTTAVHRLHRDHGGDLLRFAAFIYENAIYLQNVRGFSALEAGLLTLPVALPSLIGGPIAGRLVGIRGPRLVLCGGVAGMTLGMTLLASLPGDVDITVLILCESCSASVRRHQRAHQRDRSGRHARRSAPGSPPRWRRARATSVS